MKPPLFPDTLLVVKWKSPKRLPKPDYLFCVVMFENKPGEIIPLWAKFKRYDTKRHTPENPGRRIVFESFYLEDSMAEVFKGDDNWHRVKAWGWVEKQVKE